MRFDTIEYRYHAVGQGLFTSGALIRRRGIGPLFRWVYDCGTVSSESLLRNEIENMPALSWGPPQIQNRLELVAISHFDKDHISGLEELLKRFHVHTLLLPYAALECRIAIAFDQGLTASDPLFRLFADPVGFISDLPGGDRIQRFILVPPHDGDSTPPPPEPTGPDDDDPDARESLEGEARTSSKLDADTEPPDRQIAEELGAAMTNPNVQVEQLRPGGRLRVADLWEFVPYNNAEREPDDLAQFRQEVALLKNELALVAEHHREGSVPVAAFARAIDALKHHYDKTFGRSSVDRNLISLFLYSGPMMRFTYSLAWFRSVHDDLRGWYKLGDRIGQMFTGDGYLDNDERLRAFARFYGPLRLQRAGLFQVMHHGARGNWFEGVAPALNPELSIFCSDPFRGKTYHPHAEVLRSFWPFGPIQVDGRNGLSVLIHVE